MKQYRVFSVEMENGMKSFQLLPLSKEALFVEGKFFPSSNVLVLLHSHQKEVFDLIEKFDADGQIDISKKTNRAKLERMRTLVNVNYQLSGEDITWFIDNFCENAEVAHEVINSHKVKPLIQPATSMETAEEVKERGLIIT